MQKVYLVKAGWAYECSTEWIFSTQEKADAHRELLKSGIHCYDYIFVVEMEVK